MLIIQRKYDESFFMEVAGHKIQIHIIGIKKGNNSEGSVKLGIHAPSDVKILREELYERPLQPPQDSL